MSRSLRRRSRRTANSITVGSITILLTALAVMAIAVDTPDRADAAVTPRLGYRATVDGFTSWYGSYDMGALGPGWCIDHGIPAPDPALGYVPTSPEVSTDTATGMAWLIGRYGYTTDRVTAAALMLALHDLMGAVYPGGRLDVHALAPNRLAGFGGAEEAVLMRARSLEMEARFRSALRGPFRLAVTTDSVGPGERGQLRIEVSDADGRPVPDAGVLVAASRPELRAFTETNGRGRATVEFIAADGRNAFSLTAVAPDLELAAFAPTLRRAQRIVVPRQQRLDHEVAFEAPTPSTTTTAPPTTTTSAPPTTTTTTTPTTAPPPPTTTTSTTTTAPPTTTTSAPPTTTTTTTSTTAPPPTTTTTSTSPTTSTTTSTTAPLRPSQPTPTAPAPAPQAPPELPRTGSATGATTLVGAGVVLLGAALVIGADVIGPDGRLRPPRWRGRRIARRNRARSSADMWRTRRRTIPPSGERR